MRKNNILLKNITLTVMGFAIGSTATEYATTCAEFAEFSSFLYIPIGLAVACLITAIISTNEQAKRECSEQNKEA